jgi:hypothetical protein
MPVYTVNVLRPNVFVESAYPWAATACGRWLCTWHLQNLGHEPLQLVSAALPHSRFRSEEQDLSLAPQLLPSERAQLTLAVACCEPAGTVVENAFLILRVLWRERLWRIFARLRVIFDQQSRPETSTVVITTQPVGFSSPGASRRSHPE